MDLSQLWTDDEAPPPKLLDVLTQIAHFLDQLGYHKTFASLYKEAKKNDLILDIAEWERGISTKTSIPLLELYEEWHDANDKFPTLPGSEEEENGSSDHSSSNDSESEKEEAEGVLVDVEAEETSDDDSDEDSSSSDSDDSDASPTKAGVKRKRMLTPSSSEDSDSASDSDNSSSSDDSDAPPSKKQKKAKEERSASSSDSDSSESSDDSSSDSESDSSSDDSSSSESDSDSESDKDIKNPALAAEKKKRKDAKITNPADSSKQAKDTGSESSATLEGESAREKEHGEEEQSHVHPSRLQQVPGQQASTTKKQAAAEAKKQVVPFSRIPTDQKVDPRFASNDYVSYDYADRAYRDLSVTKGKGFTKEKNKKKRGEQLFIPSLTR